MKDQLKLNIQGMHCDGCVRRVTAALSSVKGVTVEKVDVGSAQVTYDGAEATPEQIAGAINKIGFQANTTD